MHACTKQLLLVLLQLVRNSSSMHTGSCMPVHACRFMHACQLLLMRACGVRTVKNAGPI
jgi:hypothetical protein